jgi:hypothetical protein
MSRSTPRLARVDPVGNVVPYWIGLNSRCGPSLIASTEANRRVILGGVRSLGPVVRLPPATRLRVVSFSCRIARPAQC